MHLMDQEDLIKTEVKLLPIKQGFTCAFNRNHGHDSRPIVGRNLILIFSYLSSYEI